jgi:hypothetical protein
MKGDSWETGEHSEDWQHRSPTVAEAKAIDRELTDLRTQVIELCRQKCGVSLSMCNTGEALSCIAGAIDGYQARYLKLLHIAVASAGFIKGVSLRSKESMLAWLVATIKEMK